jgi:hypothetical protein
VLEDGLVVVLLFVQRDGELLVHVCDVRVVGSQDLLVNGEGTPQQPLCISMLALRVQQASEIAAVLRNGRVVRTQRSFGRRQGPLELCARG